MPRAAGTSIENQFIKGLITEATGLNFPENACTETQDCVFSESGVVTRRLGFDFESGYVAEDVVRADSVINSFTWESVAGQRELAFVVVQFGNLLFYYKVLSTTALSSNKHAHETDLLTYDIAGAPAVGSVACEFADINGVLVVTHPYCSPIYISYSPTLDTFAETVISIKTRDFEGVPDSLVTDNRPSSLTDAHEYNLYNQGWYVDVVIVGGTTASPLVTWDTARSDFPSNADVWWVFKNASEEFDTTWINRFARGNTPAPKGHYIFDPFLTTRSSADADIGTVVESSSSFYRPGTVAAFSSRIFYSGVNFEKYNNKIYFSQILDDIAKIGFCYQDNDPTSEDLFDLLPTDGGVIVIPGIGNIIKMVSLDVALLVFASNGIWSISGSTGSGFAANDYSVAKISSVPSLTAYSFISVNGYPIWWNTDGIFQMAPDQTGQLSVQSLTDGTIKSFFDEIPDTEKNYVKGSFNSMTRVIQWLFRSQTTVSFDDHFDFDSVLNYNTITKAFYPWTIPESSERINGLVAVKGLGDAGEPQSSVFFYLTTTGDITLSFSQTKSADFLDFQSVDYESTFSTGYRIRGDAIRKFQNNYIMIFTERDEDSSCFVQGLWDFSNSPDSNRWTNRQQIYIDNPFFQTLKRRLKIRGSGISLQLKFMSETGKSFSIVGWSAFETGNQSV